MMKWQALKGDSKNQFFGRPVDRKLSVTQLPMGHLTQNFACEDLLWGTFDFCSSQGHISTEAKPFLAPKCHWPLNMSYDLDLNKNQMYLPKDPHMQNFKLIGPLGAELQTPPCWYRVSQKKLDFRNLNKHDSYCLKQQFYSGI